MKGNILEGEDNCFARDRDVIKTGSSFKNITI